jgi:uroporphyrin-III C-methyltransferase
MNHQLRDPVYVEGRKTTQAHASLVTCSRFSRPAAMSSQNTYQAIVRGASLLLAFSLSSKTILVIGGGNLAVTRACAALQADARVVVWVEGGLGSVCDELAYRASQQELEVYDLEDDRELETFLSEPKTQVSFAFITDTLMGTAGDKRSTQSLIRLREILRRYRIPTNVADMPAFCDFTIPATHRFTHSKTSEPTSLQLAVTTNGRGCRLAGRIRRDIVGRLPTTAADAVETISQLRSRAKALDEEQMNGSCDSGTENEDSLPSTPNKPVPHLPATPVLTFEEISKRRMRWIAQISEFWPFDKLGSLTPEEQKTIIAERPTLVESSNTAPSLPPPSRHSLDIRPQSLGRILLLGSGPGHPSLLTLAAHHILTKQATLVLSDKLVPAPVLALIPSHVPIKIAKKFPGNADGAQNELMVEAVEAARRGEVVVRVSPKSAAVSRRI